VQKVILSGTKPLLLWIYGLLRPRVVKARVLVREVQKWDDDV